MILKIKNHYELQFFNKLSFTWKYDSVASNFSFSMFFDPDDPNHKELLKPGHFHQCEIEHNGEVLLTGFLMNQTFASRSTKQLSSVSGYSLPGVLEDCQIHTSLYPLQSDGKTLKEISHKLINGVFPFKVEIDDSVSSKMSESYEKTTAGETQTIKAYLAGLAAQKNIILSHTAKGNLLFTKAKTDQKPFFHFDGGMSNIEMDLKFNGQGLHSRITIMKQASKDGGNAGQHEIRNSFVPFVFRPSVKTQNSGDDVDTAEAAQNALGAELKNIVLTIKVNYWEINGELLRPNTTLTVLNKELYIYKKVKWFVESVTFNGDEKQNTALLTCVLPEVYNGQMPEYFFEFDDSERGH